MNINNILLSVLAVCVAFVAGFYLAFWLGNTNQDLADQTHELVIARKEAEILSLQEELDEADEAYAALTRDYAAFVSEAKDLQNWAKYLFGLLVEAGIKVDPPAEPELREEERGSEEENAPLFFSDPPQA